MHTKNQKSLSERGDQKTAFINGKPVEYSDEEELEKFKDNRDVRSIKTAKGKTLKEDPDQVFEKLRSVYQGESSNKYHGKILKRYASITDDYTDKEIIISKVIDVVGGFEEELKNQFPGASEVTQGEKNKIWALNGEDYERAHSMIEKQTGFEEGVDEVETLDQDTPTLNTKRVAAEVGKSLRDALREVGDELDRMTVQSTSRNKFMIYVKYKQEGVADLFGFYIHPETNKLHLTDEITDEPLIDIGVKPSGVPIIDHELLTQTLVGKFKTMNEGYDTPDGGDIEVGGDRMEQEDEIRRVFNYLDDLENNLKFAKKLTPGTPEQKKVFEKIQNLIKDLHKMGYTSEVRDLVRKYNTGTFDEDTKPTPYLQEVKLRENSYKYVLTLSKEDLKELIENKKISSGKILIKIK